MDLNDEVTPSEPPQNDSPAPSRVGAAAAPRPRPDDTLAAPVRRRLYVPVSMKFVGAALFALAWVALSVWISQPWLRDLTPVVGSGGAWTVVVLVAYLPGGIVAFLAASVTIDRQPVLSVAQPTTGVTVIIAARNEEAGIGPTIAAVARADYAGTVTVVLADNGSTDGTAERARQAAAEAGIDLVVVTERKPGKSNALNTALEQVTTPYVVTVDADTLLHEEALRRLVSRLESAPPDTVAWRVPCWCATHVPTC